MFLTYGRNAQNELIHISAADRGSDCGLLCPFCHRELVAKKGPIIAHHFAHAGETCRLSEATAELIPSYEGYFIYGLSPVQRRVLAALVDQLDGREFYDTSKMYNRIHMMAQTRAALVDKGFLNLVYAPDQSDQLKPLIRLTAKAFAFDCQLSLPAFADFMMAEYRRARARLLFGQNETDEKGQKLGWTIKCPKGHIRSVARRKGVDLGPVLCEVCDQGYSWDEWQNFQPDERTAMMAVLLEAEIQRIKQTGLYFIRIQAQERTFYKIGITTRLLTHRVREIAGDLAAHFDRVRIEPLYYISQVPFVEAYFKARHAAQALPSIGTEYFELANIDPILAEFEDLKALDINLNPEDRPAGQLPARPRFRATFDRYESRLNDFTRFYDPFVLLLDIVNLDAGGSRFADWQMFAAGKSFETLDLKPGDLVEFNAAIDGDRLKRPTKLNVSR